MDFDLSEDQQMLKDSVDRLVTREYDFEKRAAYANEPAGWSRALWTRYAEMGLTGLVFPEVDGGFGGGPVELMLVMEAFGRGLVLEPYLATVVLGGTLLREAADARQRAALIPGVIEGRLLVSMAHSEPGARYDLHHVETSARNTSAGWRIDGRKTLVLHADSADTLIVSARSAGAIDEPEGISLFLVDASAPGVRLNNYKLLDGSRASDVTFDAVVVEHDALLGGVGAAAPLIDSAVAAALAALAASAVGSMSAAHELTVEYLKTRKQFGVAIGSFQALQHRAVDMLVALDQARSMALYATMMVDADDPEERQRALSAAKVQISHSGKFIGQNAIQLHGGVGMTMEYKLGHYVRHLITIDLLFGDANHHLGQVARCGGLIGVNQAHRVNAGVDSA